MECHVFFPSFGRSKLHSGQPPAPKPPPSDDARAKLEDLGGFSPINGCVLHREWMGCWGLLGWWNWILLIVSQWIIPENSLRLEPVRNGELSYYSVGGLEFGTWLLFSPIVGMMIPIWPTHIKMVRKTNQTWWCFTDLTHQSINDRMK